MAHIESREEDFYKWLSGRVSARQLSACYSTFAIINNYYQQNKYLNTSIFEENDIDVLNRILINISNGKSFKRLYPARQMLAKFGMRHYIRFVEENHIKDSAYKVNNDTCAENNTDATVKQIQESDVIKRTGISDILSKPVTVEVQSGKNCVQDRLTEVLKENDIRFEDKRMRKNGALFIEVSPESKRIVEHFRSLGIGFAYFSRKNQWYTRETYYGEDAASKNIKIRKAGKAEDLLDPVHLSDESNIKTQIDNSSKEDSLARSPISGVIAEDKESSIVKIEPKETAKEHTTSRQKLWDITEAVVLLEATIQVHEGVLTRQKAISYVSKALRGKALREGIEIDEVFRNEAGITFQMYSMEAAYLGHSVNKKTATKLFAEVNGLRVNDKSQYNALLKNAIERICDIDSDPDYQSWLSRFGNELGLTGIKKQSDGSDPAISEPYTSVSPVRQSNLSTGKIMHQEKAQVSNIKYMVDFTKECNYAFTCPEYVKYFGEIINVSSWRQVYIEVCQRLIRDYPKYLEEICDTNSSGAYCLIYSKTNLAKLNNPAKIEGDYYVETLQSATELVHSIKALLDYCHVNYKDVFICYRKTQREESLEKPAQEITLPSQDSRLYNTRPNNIKAALQKQMIEEGRRDFFEWMGKYYHGENIPFTSWTLTKISDFAIRQGITSNSLYTIRDANELASIAARLNNSDLFQEFKKKNTVAEAAIFKYIEFRQQQTNGIISQTNSTILRKKDNFDNGSQDIRKKFMDYMKEKGYADSTIRGMVAAISSASDYAIKHRIAIKSMLLIKDGDELDNVWERLKSDSEFRDYNISQNRIFSVAMKHYLAFIHVDDKKDTSEKNSKTKEKNEVIKQVAKLHPGRVEFEKWLRENNCPSGSVKTYSKSVDDIGKYLKEKRLENRDIFAIQGIKRLENIRDTIITDKDYLSAMGVDKARLDHYSLKKYIAFRKDDSSDGLDESTKKRFGFILKDCFDNGFRVNSIIDRNRFKQFYVDAYGEEVSVSDEKIVDILKHIGSEQDNRIFYRDSVTQSDCLDDIQSEIVETLNSGISCVYISELYSRFNEKLASELSVYSADVLKELLLSSSYGAYRSDKNSFYLDNKFPNAAKDVEILMRQSSVPLSYAEIYKRLKFIPLEIIKRSLVFADKVVNVAQETYFYAPNLPVNAEELNQIARLIHEQLQQKSFITDGELRELIVLNCPSVAINTEDYSTWGLRNALAVLLGNRFSFKGSIISERGEEINMAQAFSEFCQSHESLTIDELKQFAKEMNTNIYWESVYDEMVRISQNEFVSKQQVQFDVKAIDDALNNLMVKEYQSLQSFTLFLHFPVINVRWNVYVLESYLAKYSREFSLMHASYTSTNCCGAAVRNKSNIKDFKELITDVLSHSKRWTTKDDALELLVEKGYLQRKRYSGIESVLTDAKNRRDSLKK